MTKTIKEVTLDLLKEFQDKAVDGKITQDIGSMTKELQGRIIVNISVGKGYADRTVPYEKKDGTFEELTQH